MDCAIYAPVDDPRKLSAARLWARGKVLTNTQLKTLRKHVAGTRAAPTPNRSREYRKLLYGLDADEERAVKRAQEGHAALVPPGQLDWDKVRAEGKLARGVYEYESVLLYVDETQEDLKEEQLRRAQGLKMGSIYVWCSSRYLLERTDAVARAIVHHLPGVLVEAERARAEEARLQRRKLAKEWSQIASREPIGTYLVKSALHEYNDGERAAVHTLYETGVKQLGLTFDSHLRQGPTKVRAAEVRQQRRAR